MFDSVNSIVLFVFWGAVLLIALNRLLDFIPSHSERAEVNRMVAEYEQKLKESEQNPSKEPL
jgi:hypothetical protein